MCFLAVGLPRGSPLGVVRLEGRRIEQALAPGDAVQSVGRCRRPAVSIHGPPRGPGVQVTAVIEMDAVCHRGRGTRVPAGCIVSEPRDGRLTRCPPSASAAMTTTARIRRSWSTSGAAGTPRGGWPPCTGADPAGCRRRRRLGCQRRLGGSSACPGDPTQSGSLAEGTPWPSSATTCGTPSTYRDGRTCVAYAASTGNRSRTSGEVAVDRATDRAPTTRSSQYIAGDCTRSRRAMSLPWWRGTCRLGRINAAAAPWPRAGRRVNRARGCNGRATAPVGPSGAHGGWQRQASPPEPASWSGGAAGWVSACHRSTHDSSWAAGSAWE